MTPPPRPRPYTTRRGALALALTLAHPACATRGPATDATHAPAPLLWRTWDAEAFAEATRAGKLLLIDVEASWCHWCHVMDEETYRDPEVAALLARHFVTIRVDADARPDIAERYAEWGWPATALLTPDARPLLELRGFQEPREFAALLARLVDDQRRGRLVARPTAPAAAPPDRPLDALRLAAQAQLDRLYDPEEHGWGRRQKYPLAAPLEHALRRAHIRPADALWRERALATLERQLHLVDPVWGGTYQYSVGGGWERPHYEKIAAVQAGALASFARALRATGDPRWQGALRRQRDYILGHLRGDDGTFFASQDADLRLADRTIAGADYYALDDAARRALGEPRVDRSSYGDRVAQLIHALCLDHAVTGDPEPLEAARRAGERLVAAHRDPRGLYRHLAEAADPLLYLRDQVHIGRALLALHRVTADPAWLDRARDLADAVLTALRDPSGAFLVSTADPAAIGVFADRRRPIDENGLAARFLIELHRTLDHRTDTPDYLGAARTALLAVSDPAAIAAEGRQIGEYLLALDELVSNSVDVTVVGEVSDPRTRSLHRAALALDEPRAIVDVSPPGARYPLPGGPAVFLCTESACSSPVRDPSALAEATRRFMAAQTRDGG